MFQGWLAAAGGSKGLARVVEVVAIPEKDLREHLEDLTSEETDALISWLKLWSASKVLEVSRFQDVDFPISRGAGRCVWTTSRLFQRIRLYSKSPISRLPSQQLLLASAY